MDAKKANLKLLMKRDKTLTVYAVVKVEIAPRDGKRYPPEYVADYLQGAFANALHRCDPEDRVLDLSVFGPRALGGKQAPRDLRLCQELLDELDEVKP